MIEFSFRQFLEYEKVKPGFMSGVELNLGIKPEDQVADPKVFGNTVMGNVTIGSGTYSVKKLAKDASGTVTGVYLQMVDTAPNSVYVKTPDGKNVISPNKASNKVMFWPIAKFNQLRSQESSPNTQAGAGGMPPDASLPGAGPGGI